MMRTEIRRKAPRHRLTQQTRRRTIIEQATRLFAEKGFSASTRELAKRIGITQPLLFQHFPTKDDLIQAIFDTWFERMSSQNLQAMLQDSTQDLRSRLIAFFLSYVTTLYDYHWIRIYMFAGLQGGSFNRLYIRRLTEPLLRNIAAQIRQDLGVRRCKAQDVSPEEVELLWILHGGLYYSAIRKQVYGLATPHVETHSLIEYGVDSILAGMKRLLADRKRASRTNREPTDSSPAP